MKKIVIVLSLVLSAHIVSAQIQPDTSKKSVKITEKTIGKEKPQSDTSKNGKITVNEEGTKPMNKKGRNGRSASSSNSGTKPAGSKQKKRHSKGDLILED